MSRIGLIVPHIVTNVDRELLSGVFAGLRAHGHDLVVITGISNFSLEKSGTPYVRGAENGYALIEKGDFAGFLLAADWFIDRELKERLYQALLQRGLPCLVIEEENPHFPSIFPEEQEPTRQVTEHLIRVHGCRSLYFLAGFAEHRASQERLAGFRRALEENGLPFSEAQVFYGDFWTEKPAALGRRLAAGELPLPDAVVCACDTMALSLMDTLTAHGIRVPEDVKITGNDGKLESLLHTPTLTTISGRNRMIGEAAAHRLCHLLDPQQPERRTSAMQQPVFRESCGCSGMTRITPEELTEIRRPSAFYLDRYTAMTTDFIDKIVGNETLEELMLRTAAFSYRLPNWKGLAVCLCEDWQFDYAEPSRFRQAGLSETLLIGLEMGRIGGSCRLCESRMPTARIVPEGIDSAQPKVWLVTSLHCGGQIFGYLCTGYEEPDDIFLDDNYCTWCDTIAKGLHETQQRLYQRFVREQISTHFDHDPETGFYSQRGLIRRVPEFLRQHGNAVLMVIAADAAQESEFHFASMVSVAIQHTASEPELDARISDQVFLLLIPAEEQPENRMLYERLDRIEDDLLRYNTAGLHLDIPEIAVFGAALEDAERIEVLIRHGLDVVQRQLSERDTADPDYHRQLTEIRRRFKQHPEQHWSVAALAEEMHISRSHFQRLYTEQFGTSCLEDITYLRMELAKRLLSSTDQRVIEIAYACGYETQSHFMRQFKARFGMTALQFRNQNR